MMWILESHGTGEDTLTFRLPKGSVKTIGRSPGAEFMVDAALVSRLHCRLTAGPDSVDVADLDSTNGTFVNGERVRSATLRDGDRLAVGRVEFVVTKRG